jgi:hypothetical protein
MADEKTCFIIKNLPETIPTDLCFLKSDSIEKQKQSDSIEKQKPRDDVAPEREQHRTTVSGRRPLFRN